MPARKLCKTGKFGSFKGFASSLSCQELSIPLQRAGFLKNCLLSLYLYFLFQMDSNYILIAEDDEDDQFLLNSAFKDVAADRQLVFVGNGVELIDHFKKFDAGEVRRLPSLLIVDLNMPRKNGKEAIEVLIKKQYFRTFPTIVFSTTGNELEKSRCSELGIEQFFLKPSNYGNLLNIVSQFNSIAVPVKET
jgi:CheY-like chemotaxis protein